MAGLLRRTHPHASIALPDLAAAVGDDAAARITVTINTRARRIGLRVDAASGCIVLVYPARASARSVLAFVGSRRDWILRHLETMPPMIPLADGITLPLQDVPHHVRFCPDARRGVWRDGNVICVSGRTEHAPRRLKDWLKAEAKAVVMLEARMMAERLDRTVAAVSVRDTSSRWGSCTPDGKLSFSWRLILAPTAVRIYVIAHEVAHLRYMNHGPAFWQTVAGLLEGGAAEMASARHWLKRHGGTLHRYG